MSIIEPHRALPVVVSREEAAGAFVRSVPNFLYCEGENRPGMVVSFSSREKTLIALIHLVSVAEKSSTDRDVKKIGNVVLLSTTSEKSKILDFG
jgi:hypothetical protein